jgi:hypothetical protein
VAAVGAFAFAGLDDVDGLVAEAFGYVFGGAFLVAAEEELAVAVAGDGLPVVLVEGLALAVGLQDDAHAEAAASGGGDEPGEVGYFADVGELVEHAVHVVFDGAVHAGVGLADEGLEEALVEDGGDETERAVGVAGLQVDDSLAFVKTGEVELVVVEDVADLSDLQGCEADAEADDDAFLGLAVSLGDGAVLGAGEGEPVEHPEGLTVVLYGVLACVLGLGASFGELCVDDGFPRVSSSSLACIRLTMSTALVGLMLSRVVPSWLVVVPSRCSGPRR